MKNLITIGLPSKGRLKESSINFFDKNNLKLTTNGGERNYFAEVKNFPNIKIIYFSKTLKKKNFHILVIIWYMNQ